MPAAGALSLADDAKNLFDGVGVGRRFDPAAREARDPVYPTSLRPVHAAERIRAKLAANDMGGDRRGAKPEA
jgi:hypothetical protein